MFFVSNAMTPESVSRCSWPRSFETFAMQAMPGNTHQPEIFPPYFEYINYSNRNNMKQPCELGCTQIDPYIYIFHVNLQISTSPRDVESIG